MLRKFFTVKMIANQQTGVFESRQDGWCGGSYFSGWLASMFAGWIAFLPTCQRDGVRAMTHPSKQAGKQNSLKSS